MLLNFYAALCIIKDYLSIFKFPHFSAYLIQCKKCPQQYIGESEIKRRDRFLKYKGYVNNKNTSKTTGVHFNLKGLCSSDIEITIIVNIFNRDPLFRKQREKMFIQKFNTRYRGLNKLNGGWRLRIAFTLKKKKINLVQQHLFWQC